MVFRDVTSYGFVDMYQYFGQTCCLDSYYSILEMAEAGTYHILGDGNLSKPKFPS